MCKNNQMWATRSRFLKKELGRDHSSGRCSQLPLSFCNLFLDKNPTFSLKLFFSCASAEQARPSAAAGVGDRSLPVLAGFCLPGLGFAMRGPASKSSDFWGAAKEDVKNRRNWVCEQWGRQQCLNS